MSLFLYHIECIQQLVDPLFLHEFGLDPSIRLPVQRSFQVNYIRTVLIKVTLAADAGIPSLVELISFPI